ncbi:hypothetical protein WA158_001120 [Blastocystis sp. Blastoise]
MNPSVDSNFNALVFELGSYECKFGYAGDDVPQSIIASNSVQYTDKSRSNKEATKKTIVGEATPWRYLDSEVSRVVINGNISNWSAMQSIMSFALEDWMVVETKDYPMLIADSPFTSTESREKMAQLVFETYHSPALLMYRDAALTCFARGKGGGLVIDMGEDTTRVVPVIDGFALSEGIQTHTLAGKRLNTLYYNYLASIGEKVNFPRGITQLSTSCQNYYYEFCGRQMKEQIGIVGEKPFDDNEKRAIAAVPCTLPDGHEISMNSERYSYSEYFFHPMPLGDPSIKPLMNMVNESLIKCGTEGKRDLWNNVLLVGGSSCLKGMSDRFKTELSLSLSNKARMLPIPESDRRLNTFLGGSIVASLPSFNEMWVSKQEYEEHGGNIIFKKCL